MLVQLLDVTVSFKLFPKQTHIKPKTGAWKACWMKILHSFNNEEWKVNPLTSSLTFKNLNLQLAKLRWHRVFSQCILNSRFGCLVFFGLYFCAWPPGMRMWIHRLNLSHRNKISTLTLWAVAKCFSTTAWQKCPGLHSRYWIPSAWPVSVHPPSVKSVIPPGQGQRQGEHGAAGNVHWAKSVTSMSCADGHPSPLARCSSLLSHSTALGTLCVSCEIAIRAKAET